MGSTSRASWTGAISFGLVNVPVRMHLAASEEGVKFNQLHVEDGQRIRMKRVCEAGHEVEFSDIVKGYPLDKSTYVVMTDEDFEDLPLGSKKVLTVERFIDEAEIDSVQYQKAYYLEPDGAGERGYALLVKAMTAMHKVGVAKVAFKESREHLAMIRARDGLLSVHTLFWPEEVRTPAFSAPTVKIPKAELDMAKLLVENLSAPWKADDFGDEYTEVLLKRIDDKAKGKPPVKLPERKVDPAADLMATLKASVDASKKRRKAS